MRNPRRFFPLHLRYFVFNCVLFPQTRKTRRNEKKRTSGISDLGWKGKINAAITHQYIVANLAQFLLDLFSVFLGHLLFALGALGLLLDRRDYSPRTTSRPYDILVRHREQVPFLVRQLDSRLGDRLHRGCHIVIPLRLLSKLRTLHQFLLIHGHCVGWNKAKRCDVSEMFISKNARRPRKKSNARRYRVWVYCQDDGFFLNFHLALCARNNKTERSCVYYADRRSVECESTCQDIEDATCDDAHTKASRPRASMSLEFSFCRVFGEVEKNRSRTSIHVEARHNDDTTWRIHELRLASFALANDERASRRKDDLFPSEYGMYGVFYSTKKSRIDARRYFHDMSRIYVCCKKILLLIFIFERWTTISIAVIQKYLLAIGASNFYTRAKLILVRVIWIKFFYLISKLIFL